MDRDERKKLTIPELTERINLEFGPPPVRRSISFSEDMFFNETNGHLSSNKNDFFDDLATPKFSATTRFSNTLQTQKSLKANHVEIKMEQPKPASSVKIINFPNFCANDASAEDIEQQVKFLNEKVFCGCILF